ncbi:putative acyl-CoA-binding protein [Diplonema papillatum]|nr:putative acyl-CoA-binding protein [Diplonema papillatum]
MATEAEFRKAVEDVRSAKSASQAQLLGLYASFKQATDGNVKGKQPSRLQIRNRAKYDAWAKLKGMSKEAARANYIKIANAILNRAKL